MRGWSVYAKSKKSGIALYCYTCFGTRSGEEAIELLRDLGIPALWSDLFEPIALPVLRVSDEKCDAQSAR